MNVPTVAELRTLHVVASTSFVIHHPTCGNVARVSSGVIRTIDKDPRYWDGELRPGDCCFPVVPKPDAPADEPGWKHT